MRLWPLQSGGIDGDQSIVNSGNSCLKKVKMGHKSTWCPAKKQLHAWATYFRPLSGLLQPSFFLNASSVKDGLVALEINCATIDESDTSAGSTH